MIMTNHVTTLSLKYAIKYELIHISTLKYYDYGIENIFQSI